ncbi:metallophosphoesterase [Isoalcanivorax beigongshangi]|uniref:Metallophosphoesterase n=1 Tax=Isoalcanivorax beigongshangi TaxID=3238810 RepID=A0ABV4ADM8_9GAMM
MAGVNRSAALACLALGLAACGGGGSSDSAVPAPEAAARERVRMIVMGDSGTGSAGHYDVGRAMAKVCELKQDADGRAGCDLALGMGDNIYDDGVKGAYDEQFDTKFELPFEPVKLPFYMVLGNHDNTGVFGGDGLSNRRGEYQVDYHYRTDRFSERWQMPARYYRFTAGDSHGGQPLVEIFALDSNPIALVDADAQYADHSYGLMQRQWMLDAAQQSRARFKIAIAHHPYLSNGKHGNAGNYDGLPPLLFPIISGTKWKEFIEKAVCNRVDFFWSGHDHDLQVIDPVPSCGRTAFMVSGAAGKTRQIKDAERNVATFQRGGVYGFFWAEAVEGDPDTDTLGELCIEAYVLDRDDVDLGVVNAEGLTPAHVQCYPEYRKPMPSLLDLGRS